MEGKSQNKKTKKKKMDLWKMRGETFPERGGGYLEVWCGHMAPHPAFFHQLFFLSTVGITKWVGTGNQRVIFPLVFVVVFVCVL